MKQPLLFALLGAPALLFSACTQTGSDSPQADAAQHAQAGGAYAEGGESGAQAVQTTEGGQSGKPRFVLVTDPAEQAFTIQMPAGWQNQAYLDRSSGMPKTLVTAVSPDKSTVLFIGDPRIPHYTLPNPQLPQDPAMLKALLGNSELRSYVPAGQYFQEYVTRKFGNLPGFRIVKTSASPAYRAIAEEQAKQSGHQVQVTDACVEFEYQDQGKMRHALVNGVTCAVLMGWFAEVNGISTTGNPRQYQELLLAIAKSGKTDQNWKAREQAKHDQTMATMRQNHQNDLQLYNQMNQQHQARMNNIQEFGRQNTQNYQNRMNQMDQQHQNWRNNQAASDHQHDRFINTIRGENTVMDRSGNTYQVESHYDQYYVNPNDNSYIGTNSPNGLDDYRQTEGFNPDNYEEVQVVE